MSSHAFSRPIRIDNAASPRLIALVCGLNLLAAGSALALTWPLPARLIVLAALAACFYDVIRRLVLRAGARSILRIELDPGGAWRLTDADGRTFAARLSAGTRVSLPLLALAWRDEGGRAHRAWLAADAVDRRALRRLRVRLRFAADKLS